MKPTLQELKQYKHYLIKNQLFDIVKEKATEHINFDRIVFGGDYHYDDEASYYFSLYSVTLFKGEDEVVKYEQGDWKFFDKCSIISELLGEWQESYTLLDSDLEEPFVLDKL